MSNVTLSVVVPSIDIIFDDDTAAILTAVDADTVLGVTPGTIGLQILAATTGDAALSVIGAVGQIGADSISRQVVAAHSMAANPHPQYPTLDQMQLADSDTSNLVMSHVTGRAAHPDRPTFDQSILFSSFFGN